MKFTCSREDLSRGIAAVQRVVSNRGPLPILSNLLLATEGSDLKITATDLDVGIEAKVPARIRVEGAVTLAARQLAEIVNKLPNSDIELSVGDDGAQATVLCERSRFVLPSLPADEFPKLPVTGEEGATVTLPAQELSRGIRQTAFAASKDDKSTISGLLLRLADSTLEVVATDGYRLTWWKWDGAGAGNLEVIVPARAMNELARLLGSASRAEGEDVAEAGARRAPIGSVTVGKAGNQILFSVGDRFLVSRTIDGAFPNFKQIIPQAFAHEVRCDRVTLLAAVERAGIMASEREGKAIRLAFSQGDLRLWARASELGEVDEHLAVEFNGEPVEIAFNARYLEEALKALDGETATFKLNGPMQAVLISGSDALYSSLLMPIRS